MPGIQSSAKRPTFDIENIIVVSLILLNLGLWGYTALHRDSMARFLASGSYYGMFALCMAWSYAGWRVLAREQVSSAAFLRQYGRGLAFCLGVTFLIYSSVKPSFKTLGDETNLLSTSHAMVFGKKGVNELMALRSFGNFDAIATAIDQRPFLFPFMTSLLHTVLGYDARNAFLLNATLMFVFLCLVFVCARRFFNGWISAGGVMLVASNPIFALCGTSGGFDLLSCFCFGLSALTLYFYLQRPDGEKFALLWLTLLLLANTRYESFIFFFVVLGGLAIMGDIQMSYVRDQRTLVALTPLWALIMVWSRLVNSDFLQDAQVKTVFAWPHFRANLTEFLKCQLDFHFRLPYNNSLTLWGSACAVYLWVTVFIQKRYFQKPQQRRMIVLLTISMGIYLSIVFSHYAGAYSSYTNARYYLLFSVVCALLPLFGLATLSEAVRSRLSTPFFLIAIALFALYHPIAAEGRFINHLGPNVEIYFAHQLLQEHYPEKRVLVIAEWPTEYTALEYGAIGYYTANAAIPRVMDGLRRHLYQDIVVVQKIAFATEHPTPEDLLSPTYRLQTLSEYQTYDDGFIRISKVLL